MSDNESLHFVSSIDLQGLRADVAKIEQSLKGITSTAKTEAKKLDDSYSGAWNAIAGAASVAAIGMLGQQILDTTAKFERFGIVLRNTLGEQAGNDALDMIANFAATTPFQLDEVTDSFIRMANQGFAPTRVEMVKLGDLASSTGKGFNMLTEAILDAQTGEFERLKEFGIKASSNGDKVTFSFREQQTTVDKTNSAIRDYILSLGELNGIQGANALISQSLSGQISNLQDKFAAMFNEIGTSNKGVLYTSLGITSTLVEHYKDILDVIIPVVATYGAYKTVLMTTVAVQKAAAAATFAKEYFVMAKNLGFATANQIAFNSSVLANPYAIAIAAMVGLGVVIYELSSNLTEAEEAQRRFSDAMGAADQKIADEKSNIISLTAVINDENNSRDYRNQKLKELIAISPEHLNNLTLESIKTADGTAAIDAYLISLEKKIKMQTLESELNESYKRKSDAERGKANVDLWDKAKASLAGVSGGLGATAMSLSGSSIANNAKVIEAEAKLQERIRAEIAKITSANIDDGNKIPDVVINAKYWEAQAKAAKEAIDLLDTNSATYTADRAKQIAIIIQAESELKRIRGDKSSVVAAAKEEKEAKKTALDQLKEELDAKKFTYRDDLVSYKQYLDQKADIVSKGGDKNQINAVKDAQIANNKEIENNLQDLVSKYATYEGQKNEVMKRYEEDRYTLMSAGKTREVTELDKKEKDELKALNENHVKQTASYQYLFENIDKLSVDALKKRIERLRQDLALTATTAEERLAIEKALAEASDALISKAPMAALKQLGARAKELRAQINSAKTDAEKAPLRAELDGVTQKQGAALSTVFSDVSSRLSEAKTLAGLFGEELGQAVELASNIAGSFAQMASGNYVAGAIGLATTLISASKSWDAKQKANEEKKAQERVAASNELIAEANKLYSEQLDLLGRIRGVNIYGQIEATKDSLIASLTEANAAVEALSLKDKNQHYTTWDLKRTGFASIGYTKTNRWHDYNMSGLNDSLSSALNDPTFDKVKAAKAEIEKIKALMKDGTIFGDTDALKAQLDNYNELLKKAEELALKEAEIYTGSTYDSMVEAIASGFEDGTYTAEEFAKNFEDLMKKAILNALKIKWIEEPMKQWNAKFAEYMKDGVLTEDEAADLRTRMEKIKTDAAAGLEAINQAGIDLLGDAGTNAEGLSGAIQGMSQDSADLMAGQLGAMRIHLADIATAITGAFNADLKDAWKAPANVLGGGMATMNDNLALMRDTAFKANEYLAQIEVNTRRLGNIEALLGGNPTTTTPPRPNGYDKGFRDDRIMGR